MISELVREKILNLTNEEVPHSVTCVLTNYNEKNDSVKVIHLMDDVDALHGANVFCEGRHRCQYLRAYKR